MGESENQSMAEVVTKVRRVSYVDLPMKQASRAFIVGILSGIASWGLSKALLALVFTKIFCNDGLNVDRCANSGDYANIVALVLVAVAGIYFLVRFGIYRPLVVVVASLAALWPLLAMVANLSIISSIIITGVLFGIAYLAFAWLVRVRPIWLSIIFVAIVAIVTRLIFGV